MTSFAMFLASRTFCCSDLPGQSLTTTCGMAAPCLFPARAGPVLFVGHVFHPLDRLAIELFLNGDVRHRRVRRRAVPVFLAGFNPHDIARPDFFDGAARELHASETRRDDQRLAEGMRVPGGAGRRLECHDRPGDSRGRAPLERRIDSHRPGEPLGWSFAGRLRTAFCDVHVRVPFFCPHSIPAYRPSNSLSSRRNRQGFVSTIHEWCETSSACCPLSWLSLRGVVLREPRSSSALLPPP